MKNRIKNCFVFLRIAVVTLTTVSCTLYSMQEKNTLKKVSAIKKFLKQRPTNGKQALQAVHAIKNFLEQDVTAAEKMQKLKRGAIITRHKRAGFIGICTKYTVHTNTSKFSCLRQHYWQHRLGSHDVEYLADKPDSNRTLHGKAAEKIFKKIETRWFKLKAAKVVQKAATAKPIEKKEREHKNKSH